MPSQRLESSTDIMSYIYISQLDAFTLYHISHEGSAPRSSTIGPALPALGHATSGAAGTAISKLLLYPLDLVITRLQVQKQFETTSADIEYSSVRDAISKIHAREGGLRAFYSGVVPETLKGVTDSFLFFFAYTYLRQKRLDKHAARSLSVLDEIGVGVAAGALAKLFTTPIQNIVTRKQTAAMIAARSPATASTSSDLSVRDIALQIRDEKGWQGFWSGYSASLVLSLNPSITFLLHKVLLRLAVPRAKQSDPGASLTFLLAAVSKALASTITYPFSLAKTRAQVSGQKPTDVAGETSEVENKEAEAVVASKVAKARQRTVFATILRIAETEGIWALYQGLGAEVLKGFFSHGITMLMKDQIHVVIVNLYYLILKALKKYPSPEELAKIAEERAREALEQGKEALAQGKEQVGEIYVKGVEVVESAAAKVQEGLSSGYGGGGDGE